jgi:C4-dicarboxylate transporter DctQ subunit
MVPLALGVLWLRLALQICGYLRMIAHPDAEPVAVPKLITLESQVQDEIAEALGKEALAEQTEGRDMPR